MKYTTCWQKKRMACSFKHHPRHKAVKKIWVTYSVTRKGLEARQGNLSSRTRGTDVLSSGGMLELSASAAQYTGWLLLSADWQPWGVWTHGGRHWAVIRKCTLFLCHVWHRTPALALTPLFASSKAAVLVSKQPVLNRGWPQPQVKHVRELGQSEFVRNCLCSRFAVSYGPLNLPYSDWKYLGLGEIHGAV